MRIYAAAVAAVEPSRVMSRVLGGDAIRTDESGGAAKSATCAAVGVSENVRPLIEKARGVRLLAIGKAAIGMAAAAEQHLGGRMIESLAIAPASIAASAEAAQLRSRVMGAAHPLPDETSVAAARAALELTG